MHKEALDAYRKENELTDKGSSPLTNISRVVIVDLKLSAAGKHVETLIQNFWLCALWM